MTTPPDATRAVLEERARALARPVVSGGESDGELVVLGFTVSDRAHAVGISAVREVLAESVMSRLPWAPPAVAGIINIRGEVVAVADAGRLFGVADTADDAPVIVLASGPATVALRVDTIGDVSAIPPGALVPLEGDSAGGAGARLISGLTAESAVIDVPALFAELRLISRPQEGT